MRKSLLIVLCALLFSSFGFAEIIVSVSGGYTSVTMGKVNNDLTARFDSSTYTPAWSEKKTLITGGYTLGAQISYDTGMGLSFDLRSEYIAPSDGMLEFDNSTINQNFTVTYMTRFVPVLGGASFNAYIPGTPISIGASVAAGYGFANSLQIAKYTINDSVWSNSELNGAGGCFVYQGTGNLGYKFSKSMDVLLNIGYRSALVAEMKADITSSFFGSTQDEAIKDFDGNVMPFDFTGVIVQVSISNKF